ncbi:MAG: CAAX protease [Ignavibacteria bacterium CG22_combo_CG10-13_8_21_14_all_37_15]|nr:MAG: CAAX protease [Ignavibacteria bacterium CG22_combo_CG10-13_8_21_14_all_37_15]
MQIPYSKPTLSFREQISLLQSRGLIIEDEKYALNCLSHINYYRLSAYIYPFLLDNEDHTYKEKHIFKENVTFQNVIDIYNFDRELRLLLLDAIERIEVSIRTNIIYVLSQKHGPFWLIKKELFFNQDNYQSHFERLTEEIKRSDEIFIKHYFSKYSENIPPAWMTLEITSFGLLSLFYQNLNSTKDRKEISARYGLNQVVFTSWVHSIVYIRNVCAHHARIWNRELRVQPAFPKSIGALWLKNSDEIKNDRVFMIISIIIYFLSVINNENDFKQKLFDLLAKYPMVDLAPMGFPLNWKDETLFEIPPSA